MKKVSEFTGYIIIQNALYRDKEAIPKLESLIQNSDIFSVISQLNGSFRFVLESATQTFFGIDHFGGYPLFYQTKPDFQTSTNPASTAQVSQIQDRELCTLLASGFCFGEKTIFNNIQECLPGVLYTYDQESQKLSSSEWFSIDFRKQKVRKKEELSELLLSLIPDNFKQTHLALTGGIDSRLLLSLLRKKATQVAAITYGTTDNPDIKLAQRVAQESQVTHQPIYLDKLDLAPYFQDDALKAFLNTGFLGRSLPFESDWVVGNIIKDAAEWITTGFTSFWLRSPYQDQIPVPNKAALLSKIINTNCRQTLISSPKFQEILEESIIASMSHFQLENFDSDYDRWNVENRQHKYIINSCNNYRSVGIEVFLPLFDRRLMTFLNNTAREQRLEQKIYMEAIISDIFTGEDAYLKNIPSTNPKFNNFVQQAKPDSHSWKNRLLKLDKHNLNRILRKPNNPAYNTIQAVLLQSPNFLSLRVEDAFPNLKSTISLLSDLNLTNSAKHLNWLRKKRVAQLNLLGIEIIGFLIDNFAILVKK